MSYRARIYLIVIGLPKEIKNDVANFKKEFLQNFGRAEALSSPAHITLSSFPMTDIPETTLEKELRNFIKDWKSFEVQISGFDRFSNSKVLFLRPTKEKIGKFQRYMITVLRQLVKISKKHAQPIDYPHITIAKNMTEIQLNKSWEYFKDRPYRKLFKVDKITVLRKPYTIKKIPYELAFEINLNNQES